MRHVRAAGSGHRAPALRRLVLLACVSLLLGGCGLVGKPTALTVNAPLRMSVTSPVLAGGVLPAEFTCRGPHHGVSPPIFWSGAPAGTKSIAVVVDDSAAPITPRVYWLVFNIGSTATDLQAGAGAGRSLPPRAKVAYNTAGQRAYDPPCPQHARHKYRFTVYALNAFLGGTLPSNPQLLPTWTTIARHVIARGEMTAWVLP